MALRFLARVSLLVPASFVAAACQFDQSAVSIAPKRALCDQELAPIQPELLLQGSDLAEVQVGVGYDRFIYASHFDHAEEDGRLRFVTDNKAATCDQAVVLARGTLRECRSEVTAVARQIVAHPRGVQVLITEEMSAATVGLVSGQASGTASVPLMSPQEPKALAIDAQQRAHFTFVAPYISQPGTGFSILNLSTGNIKFRAYPDVLAKRVGIVLQPDQLPWLFLGRVTLGDDQSLLSDWVCRPDFAAHPHDTSANPAHPVFDEECAPLPFAFENAVADDELIHVVGTSTAPGGDRNVVFTSLTKYASFASSSDQVALGSGQAASPVITMGPMGPIIVHRTSSAVVVSRRVDGKWKLHEIPWSNPGEPKAVHDRYGNLHVFFLSDDDGNQTSDALYHFATPPCID